MIRLSAFSDEAASDLQGQIAALKRNGIPYMEIRAISGKNVKDLTLEEAKEIHEELEKNGIEVWSIGSPLGKAEVDADLDGEYGDVVRHVCQIANILKTDKIRMFSFHNSYDDRERVFENLRKMVAIAKEYNVGLYHENEKNVYGDTIARVLDIMKNVDGLKYVYDPANFVQVGEKAEDSLNALHSKVDYFHIKDVIFETSELVPAGCGDGMIEELVKRIDGDKVLTLEPHLMIFDAYKSIDTEEMKTKFHFESNDEAFDAAVTALKEVLKKAGYKEINGGFTK